MWRLLSLQVGTLKNKKTYRPSGGAGADPLAPADPPVLAGAARLTPPGTRYLTAGEEEEEEGYLELWCPGMIQMSKVQVEKVITFTQVLYIPVLFLSEVLWVFANVEIMKLSAPVNTQLFFKSILKKSKRKTETEAPSLLDDLAAGRPGGNHQLDWSVSLTSHMTWLYLQLGSFWGRSGFYLPLEVKLN